MIVALVGVVDWVSAGVVLVIGLAVGAVGDWFVVFELSVRDFCRNERVLFAFGFVLCRRDLGLSGWLLLYVFLFRTWRFGGFVER